MKLFAIISLKNASILFISMLVFFNVLNAQSSNNADTSKNKNLNEVIITGQLGETTVKNSVLKVKVIDLKRINTQGAFNLNNLLTNELNVRINYDPMLGNSIRLQGISGQNIKIMMDGVPLIGREGGNIDLAQINLSNVERIEIIEGPMGVNFGTDAMGGVINIITKKTVKNQSKLSLGLYAETIGQLNQDLQLSVGFKKLGIQSNSQRVFFYGFSPNADDRYKIWKPKLQYTQDLNFTYFTKKGFIRFNNSFFDENVTDRGVPTINSFEATAIDKFYHSRRFISNICIDEKINNHLGLNVILSYQNYRRIRETFSVDLTTLEKELVNDAEVQDTNFFNTYMSRGTITNNLSTKRINYQLGYEISYDNTIGSKINNEYASIFDIGLFGSSEIKMNKNLLFRPSVRFIHNSQFQAPVIPAINIKYDFNTLWSMRASYARGFRAPSLKELHLAFLDPQHNVRGNENLKAETGHNFQVSATRTKKLFKSYTLVIEPVLFYNSISNMIELVRLSSNNIAAQYNNISNFRNACLNLNVGLNSNTVNMQVGYAFSAIHNSIMESTNNDFFYSNEFRYNASYTFTKAKTSISLFYKYNGQIQYYQYNLNENSLNLGYMADFSLFDLTLNKYLANNRLNFTIGVKNLFNTTNVQSNLINTPHATGSSNGAIIAMGRTAFVNLKFNLDFVMKGNDKK